MVIAVDIDGVLTIETDGHDYKNRTPNKINIDKVKRLFENNHIIVLYTSRNIVDEFITKQWLELNNVLYHSIIFDKPKYDILWDDKATSNLDI